MELRSSLRNNTNFNIPFRAGFGNNSAVTVNNTQMVSPKINKSFEHTKFEDSNNILMRKRSPYKPATNGNNFIKQEYSTPNPINSS